MVLRLDYLSHRSSKAKPCFWGHPELAERTGAAFTFQALATDKVPIPNDGPSCARKQTDIAPKFSMCCALSPISHNQFVLLVANLAKDAHNNYMSNHVQTCLARF
jgi:hypothetical protein